MSQNSDLILRLAFVHSRITKRVESSLSIHGISFTEFMVMHHLNASHGKTMRRINLAESIGLTASGVTRLLNPMEKRKLVKKEKNPRDARVSLVKLSPAGERVFKDMMVSFEQVSNSIMKPLQEKQTTKLAELVEFII